MYFYLTFTCIHIDRFQLLKLQADTLHISTDDLRDVLQQARYDIARESQNLTDAIELGVQSIHTETDRSVNQIQDTLAQTQNALTRFQNHVDNVTEQAVAKLNANVTASVDRILEASRELTDRVQTMSIAAEEPTENGKFSPQVSDLSAVVDSLFVVFL